MNGSAAILEKMAAIIGKSSVVSLKSLFLQKRFWTWVLPVALLLSTTVLPVLAEGLNSRGISAYQQRQYMLAEQYFTQSIKQDVSADRAEAIFYLGLVYAKTDRLEKARQAFEQVVQMVPTNDPLAQKARNNIAYISGQQMMNVSSSEKANQVLKATLATGSQSNYLAHVMSDGKVVHFDLRKMPLKIYISNGHNVSGWTSAHKNIVVAAYQAWQRASQGKLRFVVVPQMDQADIVVRWQNNFKDNLLGVSPFEAMGSMIVRSDVDLALYYPETRIPIPTSELQAIATHELGHAIGLKGHSPYPNDIMYFSRNFNQANKLSSRDINTINLLYRTSADIQNSETMTGANVQRYVSFFNQGVEAQNAQQMAKAMQFYRQAIQIGKTAPEARYNLSVILINEGGKWLRLNNRMQAAACYKEATAHLQTLLAMGNVQTVSRTKIPQNAIAQNLQIARQNLQVVQSSQ